MQTHPERPGRHPRQVLRQVVRLLRLPQLAQRPSPQENHRHGVRMQKMQQSVQKGHASVRR